MSEAPRTVWTHLRDDASVPLDLEPTARVRGHPTLTELRTRLGPLLDTSALKAQYLSLRAAPEGIDARTVEELVERMHRAVRSEHDIVIDIDARGDLAIAAPSRLGPLRAGAEAWAWIRLFNASGQAVTVRLELNAQPRSMRVAPRGSRSFLHPLETERNRPFVVAATLRGRSVERSIDVSVEPSRRLILTLPDGPARVRVTDSLGPALPAGATARRDLHGRWYVHVDGEVSLRVVGSVQVQASRGPEFEPLHVQLPPRAAGEERLLLRLRRRAHLADDGWLSGDLHAHLHYGGEYLLDRRAAALAQRAEGLWFLNLLVANQESDVVHDHSSFTSTPLARSDALTSWGEEFRNDFYGHITLAAIERLIEPVYTGFPATAQAADYPSTVDTAERSRAGGALISSAHPVIRGDRIADVFAVPRSVEAKELPVLAALGLVDAIDLMSYPGDALRTARLWYRLLNCGLRIAASAGSDAFMNVADGAAFMAGESSIAPGAGGRFSSPIGGMRVYAHVERRDRAAFCDAIRAGRTFVTNGPLLRLSVDGSEPGALLRRRRGARLLVQAELTSTVPLETLDLVVNGRVARRTKITSLAPEQRLSWRLALRQPAWITLRALGRADEDVMDDYAFAHTSPVYVDVEGAPVRRAASFGYFMRWIDRLGTEVTKHCHFDDPSQERALRAAYARARAFFAAGAGASAAAGVRAP